MRLRAMTFLSAVALGLTLAWFQSTAVATATAADVTGTWKWTVTRGDNTFEQTSKLKQDGEKVTGVLVGQDGAETEIKDGKIKDGTISFSVTRERNGQTFTINYSGKQDGNTIKGKMERERGGEKVETDWEAKRS